MSIFIYSRIAEGKMLHTTEKLGTGRVATCYRTNDNRAVKILKRSGIRNLQCELSGLSLRPEYERILNPECPRAELERLLLERERALLADAGRLNTRLASYDTHIIQAEVCTDVKLNHCAWHAIYKPTCAGLTRDIVGGKRNRSLNWSLRIEERAELGSRLRIANQMLEDSGIISTDLDWRNISYDSKSMHMTIYDAGLWAYADEMPQHAPKVHYKTA